MSDILIDSTYTRVTEVLYPFSGLTNIDPQVLENAAQRGTRVHKACDMIIDGLGYFSENPEDDGYVNSFEKWYEGKSFIKKPSRFFCHDLMITGECDMIYKEDNDLVLVDLKTPLKESKTWALQGSAYSYLAKKMGYPITRIEFVKLCKSGKTPKVYIYKENFDLFKHTLNVFRYFYKSVGLHENIDLI